MATMYHRRSITMHISREFRARSKLLFSHYTTLSSRINRSSRAKVFNENGYLARSHPNEIVQHRYELRRCRSAQNIPDRRVYGRRLLHTHANIIARPRAIPMFIAVRFFLLLLHLILHLLLLLLLLPHHPSSHDS